MDPRPVSLELSFRCEALAERANHVIQRWTGRPEMFYLFANLIFVE